MELEELLWIAYDKSLTKAAKEAVDTEWKDMDEFDELIDNLASEIALNATANDAFTAYSFDELMNAIENEICDRFHSILNGW